MTKFLFTFSVCCILLLTLLHQVNAGPTDPVSIPDAALRAAIETKLGKSSGDTITESEMNGMSDNLTTNFVSVSNLTGLEHATGITQLKIQNNTGEITDLSPLEDLTQLTVLLLAYYKTETSPSTSLSDISPLTKLTNLTQLTLHFNSIADISPLAGLTELKDLSLANNSIVNISSLASLTKLTVLNLDYNKITDISPLSSLTALTQLGLAGNSGLSNISAVASLTKLSNIDLYYASITKNSLSAVLPSLPALGWLYIGRTSISDLSVLDQFPSSTVLEVLDLRYMSSDPNGEYLLQRGDGTGKGWLLTDISPLVNLMNAGKVLTGATREINLIWNWGLDYESLYTDIPALRAGGVDEVNYPSPAPRLERKSTEHHVGRPGTRHTFVVQAYNSTTESWGHILENDRFAKVPVTWTVTAPDGTVSETEAVTGDDGLTRVSITLGSHGEEHTAEAVVSAKQNTNGPSHDEFSVSFTVTADRDAPPPPPPPPPPVETEPGEETDTPKRKIVIKIHECPLGWTRGSVFGNTKKALIYELTVKAEPTNTTSIYQLKSLAIYVHPDENLETLDGWTLKVGTLYNQFGKEFKLTAENSVIDEHDFAHIENPEETPIPMGTLGYIGQSLPSFDYRLYDAGGVRVDFGISCYKGGGLTWRLWNTADPRLLRVLPVTKGEEALSVQMQNLNWKNTPFFRSEWTAAIMPDLPDASFAPSKPKVNVVGTWADLKRQKD